MSDFEPESDKKSVEAYLNEVDYSNFDNYVPSDFALEFVNFIKLVNDGQTENKTPVVHYRMIDNFIQDNGLDTINMCHRGIAKALDINTRIPTPKGWVSIEDLSIGDYVFGEDGKPTKVLGKSEIFNRPMYQLNLADGRSLRVCENHINTIIHRRQKRVEGKRVNYLDRRNVTTKELLNINLTASRNKSTKNPKGKENRVWVPLPKPVQYPEKTLPIDPYTLGLLLGDGSMDRDTGYARLHAHKDDMSYYLNEIPHTLGKQVTEGNNSRVGINGIGSEIKNLRVNCHGNHKFIPEIYRLGSIKQRLDLLQGLMDTDGTVYKTGCTSYTSNSLMLVTDIQELVFSLGGTATVSPNGNAYRLNISLNLPLFRLPRKLNRQHFNCQDKVALESIQSIDQVPSQCIAIDNESKTFVAGEYVVTHNSTLKEYLILYIGVYGELPNFGRIPYGIYVSDSIDNGVKKMRKSLEYRWNNSQFLQKYTPEIKFTDIRWEFINLSGTSSVFSGHGAKALALDSVLYTETGTTTIKDCFIGQQIYGPEGNLATITAKSEIFNKEMYQLELADGRTLDVSIDHINSVYKYGDFKNITTADMLKAPLFRVKSNGTKNYTFQVENTLPLEYPEKSLPDPYTLGVLLGDGSLKTDKSTIVHCDKKDLTHYLNKIPYKIGTQSLDKRNNNVVSFSLLKAYKDYGKFNIYGVKCNQKSIPEQYFYGSIEQRLELLRGLIDTDGSVSKEGKVTFCSTSAQLRKDVIRLVRSLGGTAKEWKTTQECSKHSESAKIGIWLNFNTASLPRKSLREKFNKNNKVAVVGIHKIQNVPSQCIAIDSESHQYLANDYFRTHNTGVRGTRENNSRPVIALLDDLISDSDARSPTVISDVEETIYRAIDHALHPQKRKIIWSGTPFNAKDPLYKAVESGAWNVNIYPVCEKFPCTKEEFKGAWEDRFSYEVVMRSYTKAKLSGKVADFNQELMLRILSEEDRLIEPHEIKWYDRDKLLALRTMFNFYITTDFATSDKNGADFSVISVWALNANGDWYWIDGVCVKQDMSKNIDDLFRLVQEYDPISVGVEITGQQKGFINWIQDQMLVRNCWFNLASDRNTTEAGIRPNTNKFQRFNVVLPWFKALKMHFPHDMKESSIMREMYDELSLITRDGFKSKHDDFIDTVSMLGLMNWYKPSKNNTGTVVDTNGLWTDDIEVDTVSISSYVE